MALVYQSILPAVEILDCTDPFDFKPHIHDRYVVWLDTGCAEEYTLGGQRSVLGRGEIGIIEPGRVHSNSACVREKRHLRSFYVASEFFDEVQGEGPLSAVNFDNQIQDSEIWGDLARLHHGMMGREQDLEQDVLFHEAMSSLTRRHGKGRRGLTVSVAGADWRIKKSLEYFHAHLDQPLRLKPLARLMECTESHFIRLFKAQMGIPPHAYLLQLRLERARQLILEGSSVAQAALGSGFSDQSHLNRRFKLRYGVTPGQYSRQCQFCSRI